MSRLPPKYIPAPIRPFEGNELYDSVQDNDDHHVLPMETALLPSPGTPTHRQRSIEQMLLNDGNDDARDEEEGGVRRTKRSTSLFSLNPSLPKVCFWLVALVLLFWIGVAITLAIMRMKTETNVPEVTYSRIGFADINNGNFYPRGPSTIDFVQPNGGTSSKDGDYVFKSSNGNIMIARSKGDGTTEEILMDRKNAKNRDGSVLGFQRFSLSADQEYILLETNVRKQYRHSYFAEYYIYSVKQNTVVPLTQSRSVVYAGWSPVGHSLMFVYDNDLYVNVNLEEEVRLTFDGSKTVFNGVPDWVYEEEVYGTNVVAWWSPSSTRIAFIRLDETAVPEYRVPIYGPPLYQNVSTDAYGTDIRIKYPKAGYPNPVADVWIADVTKPGRNKLERVPLLGFPDEDRLIVEVAWVGGGGDGREREEAVLIKATNRVQSKAKIYLVEVAQSDVNGAHTVKNVAAVREWEYPEVAGGNWVEMTLSITRLRSKDSYLDRVFSTNGYLHLALFSPVGASTPTTWLTSGDWEVTSVLAIDLESDGGIGRVFYESTELDAASMSGTLQGVGRGIWSVRLDGTDKRSLTSATPNPYPGSQKNGAERSLQGYYYSAKFSPGGKYYVLSYNGPSLPWHSFRSVDNKENRILENNEFLRKTLEKYELPSKRLFTIKSADGSDMNAIEILPPDFDASGHKKYNVLFRVYGGPGSQVVDYLWSISWHDALVSAPDMNWIVVLVDNRGTGFKGQKFRGCVRGRLGDLEVQDQIAAAKHMAALPYVNGDGMAIWGWSYGGYLTSKVVEANSGMYKLAMAVAPVTDWRYYDSVYTERYMFTPKQNQEGYDRSSVFDMQGFANTKYLLVHGTGDDNVHFQNTVELLARLTSAAVHNYRVQVYPDSDHSMGRYGASQQLYKLMTEQLLEVGRPSDSGH